MVYIGEDGNVVCNHLNPKNMLDKMRLMSKGKSELIPEVYAPVAGVPYPNAVCALALRLTTDESKADLALKNIDILSQLSYLKMLHNNFDTAAEQAIAFLCAINMQRA